ncbi:MAG: AAA family ATPase [Acidobacteriia bacterium]|nr:AAA family ATPase [Terriglobia bacterium]
MAGPAVKFNPGFLSDQELVDSFCVRVPEFEMLLQTIRESTDSSNPHQLVVGPRGSGKTTLLLRVVVELKRDPELSRAWLPVIFPEESYEIATCGEFWMQCLTHLANQSSQRGGGIDLARTLAEARSEQDDQRLAARCLAAVLDFAAQEDRRLLLIVENLNMLFDDINDPDVGWQLRHTLQNEKRIFLLASATSRFDEVERYGRAMYDLFNVQELQRLDTDACSVLWKAVSHRDPDKGVIRSLEILTGGNPRLLAIIARFGAMLSLRELMDNLLTLVDDHTEYFKSHLDALGVQERRVYLALARLWMPATAREVAEHARLPTNNCSALLGRLVDRGAVLIGGGGPRRKQYYVAERMYNIYYLLRISRGSDRLVEALVRFMRSFYSQSDLQDYLDSLRRDPDSVDPIVLRQFGQALERADPYIEFGQAGSRELRELAARADELLRSQNWDPLIRTCEEIESKVPSDASMSESEYLADSRNLRVTALIALGHLTEAESLCSATWSAYSGSDVAPLRKVAAIAGAKRLELLALSGQSSETILEASEDFLGRFSRDSLLGIAEPQAAALLRKAAALGSLGREDEALAAHEELIARFERDTSPAVESCVIAALHAKGLFLDRSGEFDKARAFYDLAIHRFGDGGSSQGPGRVGRLVGCIGGSFWRA